MFRPDWSTRVVIAQIVATKLWWSSHCNQILSNANTLNSLLRYTEFSWQAIFTRVLLRLLWQPCQFIARVPMAYKQQQSPCLRNILISVAVMPVLCWRLARGPLRVHVDVHVHA